MVVCVSNPRVPGIKWESEKEQFLETHKSASPVFGAASKRHYFKGGESQHWHPRSSVYQYMNHDTCALLPHKYHTHERRFFKGV